MQRATFSRFLFGGKRFSSNFTKHSTRGPISWKTLAVAFGVGSAGLYYLSLEKEKLAQLRKERDQELQAQSYGKVDVGGPFELVDCESGRTVTDKDFLGKFMVIYFGFTNCPDVCPDELEKMSKAITTLDRMPGIGEMLQPVFISVDPERDSPEVVKTYIKEFHPRFQGLTGTEEQTTAAAKKYRIYISKGSYVSEDNKNDYLVDHSIFFFLMYPDGTFADYYGRNMTSGELVDSISKKVQKWKLDQEHGRVSVNPQLATQ